ncbi:MAG: immune inhibitor A, partial [Anaerolineae bacterium]|nr:immune inhibitor A [Anaerolineae bacterium]
QVRLDACYGDGACSELVQNRGFEWSGSWWWGVTPRPAQYTTDAAHSGARSMRLGVTTSTADTYSHSSTYQHITIPSGATNPTLTFWYKAHSQDTIKQEWTGKEDIGYNPAQTIAGTQSDSQSRVQEDWQEMLILDADYKLLSGGVVLRQVRNDGTWMKKSYDLSPYKGMEIVLYFNVINDGNGKRTWMYVDDVSVNLCGQQVHFEPASKQVNVGDTFEINVRVENIGNLYALDTTIGFDPAILEVTDAKPGGWWTSQDPYVVAKSIDNTNGKLRFAATLQNPDPALNGSGNLVAITFHAKKAGGTALTFSALKLVDKNAVVIPATHADGQVTVSSGQATLSGKVLLQGRSNHSGTIVQIDGGATVTTQADGSYSLNAASGAHTLRFTHASYLAHELTTSATNVPQVTLLGGEMNNDGCIDILDLTAITSQFGSTTPDPAAADINGDGIVDIVDIVLVAKNFGTCAP